MKHPSGTRRFANFVNQASRGASEKDRVPFRECPSQTLQLAFPVRSWSGVNLARRSHHADFYLRHLVIILTKYQLEPIDALLVLPLASLLVRRDPTKVVLETKRSQESRRKLQS